jgi:peptidyl-prolyl cis-trans isomerase C
MKYSQILAVAAAGLLLASGCTKADTPADAAAKPVAVVNGTPISREVWELFVKTRHGGKTPGQLTVDEQNASLEELIRMYAGAQEAQKQNLDTGEPNARFELAKTSALAELLFKKYTEGAKPTEAEMKAEYDAAVAQAPKAEFHARHILVEDEAKAKDLIAQLGKGANFEKLATEHSKDSSSTEGGDLGWFMPSQMVKPFADAVQKLEKGTYTAAPVKSEFGWHVIKLEDTRPTTPPPYESVKTQLEPMVHRKKFEEHLKGLVTQAKVERSL